ncbi:chemotaxis protein CheA [Serpentinicella alkaliphila]|uniref:Chemotaxis protein CheA n=1 Tax=Serpentinicella alkaliphila TaxID=1734049 RepID=A0A4R2TJB9_9FIRM|nr:histidine kinase/DNA gyrase B/HSP90-like ATPase [Serpentinicella alkaliphila]
MFDNEQSLQEIRERGFTLFIKADKSYEEINEILLQCLFLKSLELTSLEGHREFEGERHSTAIVEKVSEKLKEDIEVIDKESVSSSQSIISVNVMKLDKLMDLVGEMVIAEAMVTQNPDLKGLELENFQKAARQLRKITSELQDTVMSIRMVPMTNTFQKMHRIVRDMSKKLGKEVKLEIIGEETEVDKNIIDNISDPIMHLVRNAIDHGIELAEERESLGKLKKGTVTLEAKNVGSDVLIIIKDDGRGLDKARILKKAKDNGILTKPEAEMTDKEIYNLIFIPGFSTKEDVTEFSGRGVGMDVVIKNIEAIGGSASIESFVGSGSVITLKIPLTLAIIEGMNIQVGASRYTLPTTVIKQSFRPLEKEIIKDPHGNEMIMVRGHCYPILRLHKHFRIKSKYAHLSEGILIMIEQEDQNMCIFADELIGHQQVVVKSLPNYIKNTNNVAALTGCTLLGDGSISLILDIGELFQLAR